MKIIISHDVDHLYGSDHLTDLFYPKLWARESHQFLRRRISAKEWALRMAAPFHRNLHHLEEIMRFDQENGIPSTFFFGMEKGLGMSYGKKQALNAICRVQAEGFATGVHGIAYNDAGAIHMEYKAYEKLTGCAPQGIRMHYVRYTDKTLQMLSDAGYAFDSTEFDKKTGYCVKAPYQVGGMWEFPLTIMDVYLPYDAQKAKEITVDILRRAMDQNTGYCTILFHDTNFSAAYQVYKDWYEWLIGYCRKEGFGFSSFQKAMRELKGEGK
jgi:hypothetical protein